MKNLKLKGTQINKLKKSLLKYYDLVNNKNLEKALVVIEHFKSPTIFCKKMYLRTELQFLDEIGKKWYVVTWVTDEFKIEAKANERLYLNYKNFLRYLESLKFKAKDVVTLSL